MKVWIEQDQCTGDGLCEEIAPTVFGLHDDGLAYVKGVGQSALCGEDGTPVNKGTKGLVAVSTELEAAVTEAEGECPGECIHIENDD
jgi:ferredoxin